MKTEIVYTKRFRKTIFIIIRLTLIPFFIREFIQRKRVTIILFHNIKREFFDMHIRILKSRYNIISLNDYILAKKEKRVDKLPPKSLIITIDDGHKSNFDLMPIFIKCNIPVTIFLCSGLIGTNRHFWFLHPTNIQNYEYLKKISDKKRLEILNSFGFEEKKEFGDRQALSKNEIDEMKKIVDFQSHTIFHSCLPTCSKEKSYEEIVQSKKDLEHFYGFKIYALSYPNGDYSNRDITTAKRNGYICGLTLDVGFNSQNTDIFKLKRMNIPDDADINELLVKTSGFWHLIKNISIGETNGLVKDTDKFQ